MRTLLPRIVLAVTLGGFPAGGAAWAQGGKDAPVAEDPAALLEQASAAYEGKDYPAALVAARRSAELAPGKDSVLAYQIWLVSAEQVGDLDGMAAALDAYAAVPGLGKSSVAIIDKARPRLEFYRAEQAGRVDVAEAALRRVRTLGAPDPGWLQMAERRLDLREQLQKGQLGGLVGLSSTPGDSIAQQSWVRALRGEAVAQSALGSCKHPAGLVAVDDLLTVPYRTPDELRRAQALQVRLRTEAAIKSPGKEGPVALSKALEPLGALSPEDRVWLARVAMRAEQDADWEAGRYGEVLDLREHYRSLAAQAPVEPDCLSPKVWLEADEATYRAKEIKAQKLAEEKKKAEEEAKKRAKRQALSGPTSKQKKASTWLFVGAGASALAAGAFGGSAWHSATEIDKLGEGSFTAFEEQGPGLRSMNNVSIVAAPVAGAAALGLLSSGFVVRW